MPCWVAYNLPAYLHVEYTCTCTLAHCTLGHGRLSVVPYYTISMVVQMVLWYCSQPVHMYWVTACYKLSMVYIILNEPYNTTRQVAVNKITNKHGMWWGQNVL